MKRSTLARLMVLAIASCTGEITGSVEPGANSAGGGSAGTPVDMKPPIGVNFTCVDPQMQGVGDVAHRLTRAQIVNTLKDLFGAEVVADRDVQTALNRISPDIVADTVKSLSPTPSAGQAAALYSISVRTADLAVATPAKAAAFFGGCASEAPITDACVSTFVTTFGAKVLRRPLSSAEVSSYLATYKRSNGAGLEGLRMVLMRMLQSPAFAFRIESGQGPSSGGRTRLTDHEIASRISYLVGDTMPDKPLFEAAAKGELQMLSNVQDHVQRLLTVPSAKEKLSRLFSFYLGLGDTPTTPHPGAVTVALPGMDPAGLAEEMFQEAFDFISHQIGRKDGKFFDLLTSTAVFPRSPRMAKILETSVVVGPGPSQTNGRHAGVLLRPAVLASASPRTPAMHRGKVVSNRLLCTEIPPPPLSVDELIDSTPRPPDRGNRAWLEPFSLSAPECIICHTHINPPGFALEGYDQLGMTRTRETTFNTKGAATPLTFPIDTKSKNVGLGSEARIDLAGSEDLVSALAGGSKAQTCFARTAFEFYRLREMVEADSCALRDLEEAATDKGSLPAFFLANIANEAIFWRGN